MRLALEPVQVQQGERRGATVEVSPRSRVTLHADDVPVGGRVRAPFIWDDLLASPRPPRDAAPPRYCIPGPGEFAGAQRVESALIVSLDRDGVVQLEHRLGVVERVMG